jgi:hypothetical protein
MRISASMGYLDPTNDEGDEWHLAEAPSLSKTSAHI